MNLCPYLLARLAVRHDLELPRLRVAGRRGKPRRLENLVEQLLADGLVLVLAYTAPALYRLKNVHYLITS
jgi:hypothetical protein